MDKRPYHRNDRPPIPPRDYHSPDRRYVDRNNRSPDRFGGNRGRYQELRYRARSPNRRSPDRRSPNRRSLDRRSPNRRSLDRRPPNNRRTPDKPDYVDCKKSPVKESRSRSASNSDVSSSSSSSSAYSSRSRSNSTNSQRNAKIARSPKRMAVESGSRVRR